MTTLVRGGYIWRRGGKSRGLENFGEGKHESSMERYNLGTKEFYLDFKKKARLYNHCLGWVGIKRFRVKKYSLTSLVTFRVDSWTSHCGISLTKVQVNWESRPKSPSLLGKGHHRCHLKWLNHYHNLS